MLCKITNDFYIKLDQVYMVEVVENKIMILLDSQKGVPYILSADSSTGKKFLKMLDEYLGDGNE